MSQPQCSWDVAPTPPVIEPIRRLADDALADFGRALQLIRTRADQLFACHEEIASQRKRIEERAADLDRRMGALEEREAQISQRMADFENKSKSLESRDKALIQEFEKVRESRKSLDADRAMFTEQIEKLESEQASLNRSKAEIQELHSRMLERESEFATRDNEIAQQEARVKKHAEEIDAMRENMSVLSGQLEREHGELVKQRTELVARFGGAAAGADVSDAATQNSRFNTEKNSANGARPENASEFSMPAIDLKAAQPEPAGRPDPDGDGAKPGGVADQFRKLRRDAKRRIKGLT